MEDKFKLDRLNIYMIIVTTIVFIILVISCIRLAKSNKTSDTQLPKLETTAGNTSTQFTTTSTTTTTTTVVTTTIDYSTLNSPYYNVEINLNDDIYKSNEDLNDEKAKQIVTGLLKYANALFDTNDYSIFNTDLVNKAAKEGETDKIVENGATYIELYNLEDYIDKLFVRFNYDKELNLKYKDKDVFIKKNGKFYRLVTDITYNYDINTLSINKADKNEIKASISYKVNSGIVYKKAEIVLNYKDYWKIADYVYPM